MSLDKMLFHPLMVHFPIALCFFEFLLLLLARFKKNRSDSLELLRFARLSFRVMGFSLIPVLITGWRDAGGTVADLFEGGVEPHFYSACVFSALLAGRIVLWKRFNPEHPRALALHLAGSMILIAAIVVTAYWGGELVYG